jgi:hypothetical protein
MADHSVRGWCRLHCPTSGIHSSFHQRVLCILFDLPMVGPDLIVRRHRMDEIAGRTTRVDREGAVEGE